MPKTEGCWANILDDCDGPLTGEHLISVAIFAPAAGKPNNRSGRLKRRGSASGGHHIPDGPTAVRDLKAPILCEHHNGFTNELDNEGGRFARALEAWSLAQSQRNWLPVTWAKRTYEVNGPLLERLLLKLAINNAFLDGGLPIGGVGARPGWPTRELVEMVYGIRPIVRPAGLFNLSIVGQKLTFNETFTPIYFDNGRYREGCVWMFRELALGVQFTTERLPERTFDGVPTLRGTTRLQPFNGFGSGENVELRLRW